MNDRRQSRVTLTRGDLGQYASFLFAFFALLTVLARFYQGMFQPYIFLLMGLAGVSLALWILLTPREFRDFVTGRRARRGTVAFFSTILFVGIVVTFYVYVERAVITFDLTQEQSYTLSQTTQDVIDNLNRKVRITGFYSSDNIALRELDDQFWRQYTVMSDGMIEREYIDPVEQPAVAEAFGAEDGDVFLSYLDEDGTVDMNSVTKVPLRGKQERDMTQAINRLLRSGNFTAYYDLGYSDVGPNDTSESGVSASAQQLFINGWNVLSLDLQELAENDVSMPDDATAMILNGPTEPLSDDVIALLDDYLARGGTLFIMADATFSDERFMGQGTQFNTYLWENWGLRMLDAVAVEQSPNVDSPSPLDVVSYQVFDSPITRGINRQGDPGSRTQFHISRVVEVDDTPPVNNGRVIMTSSNSFGETNLEALGEENAFDQDEADFQGPLTTAGFAFNESSGGRVLLVGDSDFLTNRYITSPAGNMQFFTNGMNWLSNLEQEVSFGFEREAVAAPTIFVSPAQIDEINFFILLVMPGAALLLGAGIWYYRSRR